MALSAHITHLKFERKNLVSGPHVPTGVWFPSGTLPDLTPYAVA